MLVLRVMRINKQYYRSACVKSNFEGTVLESES